MANFMNSRNPTYLANRLGWLYIGVLIVIILLNLSCAFMDTGVNCYDGSISLYRDRKIDNHMKEVLQAKIELTNDLSKADPIYIKIAKSIKRRQ